MIDKIKGKYVLICDICGEEYPETFNSFYKAVQYKRDEGWKSHKHQTEHEDIWEDVCPQCQ
jgi:hypothetical protein